MNEKKNTCCSESPAEVLGCSAPPAAVANSCCDSAIGDSQPAPQESACSTTAVEGKPTAALRRWIRTLHTAWSLVVLIPLLVWLLDPLRLQSMLTIAATALSGTLVYILVAVLMLAYLKASGAENVVAQAFVGRENRMIVLAALFGGLAPFCSCEVIPFIAGLLALGAPVSAVMAFWLSSPLIDPPSLMITAGALGWEFAVGKALSAVALGLFGGFGIKAFSSLAAFSSPLKSSSVGGCGDGSCAVTAPFAEQPRWDFWRHPAGRAVFRQQGLENALFLLKWLTVAYLLEALLILYVPASLIGGIVGGDGLGAIALGAVVGMPAYLNSYAAPPLVAGLMEQGMSSGAAMAFMVAGAISSIPAMTAVWSLVKRPVFAAYLGFGVSGAILFGAVFALVAG